MVVFIIKLKMEMIKIEEHFKWENVRWYPNSLPYGLINVQRSLNTALIISIRWNSNSLS